MRRSTIAVTEVTDGKFRSGQVWTYRTRVGEESSRAFVGRVDQLATGERIVHVALVGLRMENPQVEGGYQSIISHAPVLESSCSQSVLELQDQSMIVEMFAEGYATWREAFDSGGGGFFTVELKELPDLVEFALRQPPTSLDES